MKFKALVSLILLLAAPAYGATNREIYATAIKNGSGKLFIPSTTPTASRVCVFDPGSIPSASSVTSTELGYLSGVTSSVQTQLNGKELPLTFSAPLSRSTNTVSIPAANGSTNGYLSQTDWSAFNAKEPALAAGTTAQYFRGDKSWQTLNTAAVPESGNLYFTDARARGAVSAASPLTFNSGTGEFGCQTASGSQAGCLASADWSTFNGKESVLTFNAPLSRAANAVSISNIADAQVSASAAIARSKLASGTASHVLINDGSGVISSEASLAATRGGTAQTTYATGDTLYASASNTLSKLAVGSQNQIMRIVGGIPSWTRLQNPATGLGFIEDFLFWNSTATKLTFATTGGAAASEDATAGLPDNSHPGIIKLTVDALNDVYMLHTNAEEIVFGGGETFVEWMVYLPDLSTTLETYTLRVGACDSFSGTSDCSDGLYWYYTNLNNSGNWSLRALSAGNATQSDSSTAVAEDTWIRLGYLVNSDGTSVQGYINGVAAGSPITTNIVTTYARKTAIMIKIAKTVATTNVAKAVIIDYVMFDKNVTR